MEFFSSFFDPQRFPVAGAAVFLTMATGLLTGPVSGNARPFFWQVTDRVLGGLALRLDKPRRAPADLVLRGALIAAFGIIFGGICGWLLIRLSWSIPFFEGGADLAEIVFLTPCLTGGAVLSVMFGLYRVMGRGASSEGAYFRAARSAGIDMSAQDDYSLTRLTIAFSARMLCPGLIAPVFWYLAGGLVAVYAYGALAALAFRFGRDGHSVYFAAILGGAEKIAGFLPGLMSGALLVLASAFTPTAGIARACRAFGRGKGSAVYAQGGLPLSVMAWALDVSLGGAVTDMDGHARKNSWTGPENATARLEPGHLKRAIYMFAMAGLLLLAGLVIASVLSYQSLPS
jgi:adenosylcobinamide-phosphate synthase